MLRRRAAIAVTLFALTAVTACAALGGGDRSMPSTPIASGSVVPIPSRPPTSSPSPSSSPSSSPSPSPTRPPGKLVEAGVVTDTRSRRASGEGPARIGFTTKGKFALVVRLDCSRCRGPYQLTESGRLTPFGRGTAPAEPSYLMRQLVDDVGTGTLELTARGSWRVTLLSWNELTPVRGKQSGEGPSVLYLSDFTDKIAIRCRPANAADSCHVQLFNTAGDAQLVGDDDTLTTTEKFALPGVVAVRTNGRWTITPQD